MITPQQASAAAQARADEEQKLYRRAADEIEPKLDAHLKQHGRAVLGADCLPVGDGAFRLLPAGVVHEIEGRYRAAGWVTTFAHRMLTLTP